MKKIKGIIFTENYTFQPGEVTIDGAKIAAVEYLPLEELTSEESEHYLLPGLVDIHFHGCAGYDFCDGTIEAYRAIETYENTHGITSICPATMTFPPEKLMEICTAAAQSDLDSFRGIYLEGPFLSMEKRGAQNPAYLRKPDLAFLDRLQECAGGLIKIAAIAPELEGAMECIQKGKNRFRFSIAHTAADYETADRAIHAGACHITHLYNAMPPFLHREPGVVGAAADHPEVEVELICDGIHVHPGMVRSTFRLFGDDRVILISDSTMATGMKDGTYTLGGQNIHVHGRIATLEDGTIAGSVTNLYDCMVNAVSMGIPKEAAIRAATINPARSIGIEQDYGTLKPGKQADILITDKNLQLKNVVKRGKIF